MADEKPAGPIVAPDFFRSKFFWLSVVGIGYWLLRGAMGWSPWQTVAEWVYGILAALFGRDTLAKIPYVSQSLAERSPLPVTPKLAHEDPLPVTPVPDPEAG